MIKKLVAIRVILAAVGTITSSAFVIYGAGFFVSEAKSPWTIVFGVLTLGYGLSSIVILALACSGSVRNITQASSGLGIAYLLLWAVGSLDAGMFSTFEFVAVLIVTVLLALNWLSVTGVVRSSNVT